MEQAVDGIYEMTVKSINDMREATTVEFTGEKRQMAGGSRRKSFKGRLKRIHALLTAAVLTAVLTVLGAGSVLAAEERAKITDINLNINSTIEAGSSSGRVYVTTSDTTYRVGGVEILNDDDDWMGGMTPRVSVELYANSGYYFSDTSKKIFSFSGDDASYVTARREDDKSTLVLTMKLDKLDNGDLSVEGAVWDEGSGTASWDENPAAKYYQVKLYRDNSSVTGIRTTYETYFEFAGSITRRGDYYFTVRAVGSGSEKGDWESSDSWYVTAYEADDLSYGYSDGPGGSSHHSNGGPGVSGGSGGPGGGYNPGPGGWGSGGSGGPGVSGGSGGPGAYGGVNTGGGNHWCLDTKGWWYQYSNGSYPVNCWQQIDGKWYCFGQDGYIRCGWIDWNGKWYYTDASGAMLQNTRTPDGFYVGGDGAWIQ